MSKPIESSSPTPESARGIRPAAAPADIAAAIALSAGPHRHQIVIGWGDCDPAQIAYTANIPAWGLRAIESWYKACLGVNWFEINLDLGIGTPFVQLGFDFQSPVVARAPLDCSVFVTRVGRRSLAHLVEGSQDGRLCFTGHTTAAFVAAGRLVSIAIPPMMLQSIRDFADRQGRDYDDFRNAVDTARESVTPPP